MEPDGVLAEPGPGATLGSEPLPARLLLRYRVMAFTTATLLIVLVFAGLPLQLAAHRPELANVVGTIHGFLYLIYLFVAFQLTRRLGIPKWQVALVLVAGTIPFCAFVAERNMSKRFAVLGGAPRVSTTSSQRPSRAARVRSRWLSRRALLLHLEVLLVAPACVAAGWWQATRALSGNGLSWFYSVEWPVFALLAIAGWWYLLHEDPEVYRARKERPASEQTGGARLVAAARITVEVSAARLASLLAAIVALEFGIGIAVLVFAPPGRPSGWLPTEQPSIYLAHAVLGLPLALGSVLLLARVRNGERISRLSGWIGAVGVGVASVGGLLTDPHSLRLAGMALMFLGAVVAGFGYLLPTFQRLDASAG